MAWQAGFLLAVLRIMPLRVFHSAAYLWVMLGYTGIFVRAVFLLTAGEPAGSPDVEPPPRGRALRIAVAATYALWYGSALPARPLLVMHVDFLANLVTNVLVVVSALLLFEHLRRLRRVPDASLARAFRW